MQTLKALVITLGILILIAFGFMAYGVATKFGKEGEETLISGTFRETRVIIPAGARILETNLSGGRFVVRVAKPDGGEALVLIDVESGKGAGLIHLDQALSR
jgi:hypothetical protein